MTKKLVSNLEEEAVVAQISLFLMSLMTANTLTKMLHGSTNSSYLCILIKFTKIPITLLKDKRGQIFVSCQMGF